MELAYLLLAADLLLGIALVALYRQQQAGGRPSEPLARAQAQLEAARRAALAAAEEAARERAELEATIVRAERVVSQWAAALPPAPAVERAAAETTSESSAASPPRQPPRLSRARAPRRS
jgi:hypothetical protein